MSSSHTNTKNIIEGNSVIINVIKSVDKNVSYIGDTLTYTMNLKNEGNIAANNLIFTDIIPNGTEFDLDSLTINGESNSINPEKGIKIKNMIPQEVVIISFRVNVISIPVQNLILSEASVTFQFTLQPSQPAELGRTKSNIVSTQVNNANLLVTKVVDKKYADIGDTLRYTVSLTNSGNVEANNIILKEKILDGISFIENSLSINGIDKPAENPTVGVNIGSISSGETIVVIFGVRVDIMPGINPIQNISKVWYEFIIDKGTPSVNKEAKSNEVKTKINAAYIDIIKKIDKQCVTLGEVITFNFRIKNKGNIQATDVLFRDVLPDGTNFIINSFTINGVLKKNEDPIKGVNLGVISSEEEVDIAFNVIVNSMPVINENETAAIVSFQYRFDTNKPPVEKSKESNKVYIRVSVAKLEVSNSVDKMEAIIEDVLTYNVTIKNLGNMDVEDVIFTAKISEGATLVKGSLLIDGIPYLESNIDTGINIGTIILGKTIDITYMVKVELRPASTIITNICSLDFKYVADENGSPIYNAIKSNETVTRIEEVKINVVSVADKVKAVIGDIITYTINITNYGTITSRNVFLKAQIPDGTSLVATSLTSVTEDGCVRVNLGDILPDKSIIVIFKVKIEFVPYQLNLINKGIINFEYGINGQVIKESICSNLVSIDVSPSTFKHLSISSRFNMSSLKPDVHDILSSIVDIEIINIYTIKTMKSVSIEGQALTGNKLIVHGRLKEKIEYVAENEAQSVHGERIDIPFSTFIVLPENFYEGAEIEVEGVVEDVYIKIIDKRTLFQSTIFRLVTKLRW